jgi:acetyltransferase-like isoleucine patch superfamily enzyme
MPLIIEDTGSGNNVDIPSRELEIGSGRIILSGEGNNLVIQGSHIPIGLNARLTGGATLKIGSNLSAGNLFVFASQGAEVTIGDGVGFNGHVRVMMHEAGQISVGNGCLFADFIDITNSDMHSIIDIETGKRINVARDVLIEDRVWVGQRCMVLKGSHIGRGSIVGAGSVVSTRVPENSLVAGNPIRVLRSGVTWDFRLL